MIAFVRCVGVIALSLLVMLGALATTPCAVAGDARANTAAKGDSTPINLDQSIQQPEKAGVDPSSADSASAAADLESTRSAIDHRTGAAITLSVSGWVGEQVMAHGH